MYGFNFNYMASESGLSLMHWHKKKKRKHRSHTWYLKHLTNSTTEKLPASNIWIHTSETKVVLAKNIVSMFLLMIKAKLMVRKTSFPNTQEHHILIPMVSLFKIMQVWNVGGRKKEGKVCGGFRVIQF